MIMGPAIAVSPLPFIETGTALETMPPSLLLQLTILLLSSLTPILVGKYQLFPAARRKAHLPSLPTWGMCSSRSTVVALP